MKQRFATLCLIGMFFSISCWSQEETTTEEIEDSQNIIHLINGEPGPCVTTRKIRFEIHEDGDKRISSYADADIITFVDHEKNRVQQIWDMTTGRRISKSQSRKWDYPKYMEVFTHDHICVYQYGDLDDSATIVCPREEGEPCTFDQYLDEDQVN